MRIRRGALHYSVNNTQIITVGRSKRCIRFGCPAVIFFSVLFSTACTDKPPAPPAAAVVAETTVAAPDTSSLPAINCSAPADANDRSICPGQRVGAVMMGVTRSDLERIYGPQAVRTDSVYLGEGEWGRGIGIKASATDSLIVTLIEDSLIGTVFIRSPGWRTVEGLGIGSSLEDLERVYKTVRVFGFEFDGAGAVMLPDSVRGIWFRVYPTVGDDEHQEAWNKVAVGNDYPSTDPNMRVLKPAVTEIRVTFRNPQE